MSTRDWRTGLQVLLVSVNEHTGTFLGRLLLFLGAFFFSVNVISVVEHVKYIAMQSVLKLWKQWKRSNLFSGDVSLSFSVLSCFRFLLLLVVL